MTYFEPAGRGEGSDIRSRIGALLRSFQRVTNQCSPSTSVRSPFELSPISTAAAAVSARASSTLTSSFHDLRGTWETLLLDAGVLLRPVADRCSHEAALVGGL